MPRKRCRNSTVKNNIVYKRHVCIWRLFVKLRENINKKKKQQQIKQFLVEQAWVWYHISAFICIIH